MGLWDWYNSILLSTTSRVAGYSPNILHRPLSIAYCPPPTALCPLSTVHQLRPLVAYKHHSDGVVSAVVLPGGDRAASCDMVGDLHIWSIESGEHNK